MDKDQALKILYIEDDHEMIELIEMILSRRGYKVIGAQGGRKGLDIAREVLPDIILLDLMMPDLDGWDVYQQLKSREETKNIPVIVITAKAQPIDRVFSLQIAKVTDYIAKPFRPHELLSSIDRILERNQETQ